VPYQRFHEVNTRAQTLEAENARLQAQLTGHQQTMQQQVQTEVAKVRQEQGLRVALARNGVVSDPASDFLVAQYQGLGPAAPPADAWVQQRKVAEPYFFGQSSAPAPTAPPTPSAPAPAGAPPAAPPPAAPPAPPPADRGNPNAGIVGAPANPPTQDPPLTAELIDQMDYKTYTRRRAEIQKFQIEQQRQQR
jgi:hypothetical protein